MQNTTILSNKELAVATRTNTPDISAPQEYQNKITEVSKTYLNHYMCKYTCKDVIGLSELLPIVRNRFENLTVEGIQNETINKVSDVNDLLRGNSMLEPLEEKAIIEAYHNCVPEAAMYIQIFFSFKVYDFMKQAHLFGKDNDQDIYCSLQAYLYELVNDFDFEKIAHGGLPKKYYRQKMYDYWREEIVGKQTSLLTYNRRQAYDLSKARKITEYDSRTMTLTQLSQAYNVPKSAIMLHFITATPIRLDVECNRDDGETTNMHESIEDPKNYFDGVERAECLNQMLFDLEAKKIERATTIGVLSAIIAYTYSAKGQTKQGHIRKLSQKSYCQIAQELHIPVFMVKTVVNEFVETFAS